MFGAFSSIIEAAQKTALDLTEVSRELVHKTGLMELEKGYNKEDEAVEAGDRVGDTAAAGEAPPKNSVLAMPPHLAASLAEWNSFISEVLREENTYSVPPSTILENTEAVSALQALNIKLPPEAAASISTLSESVMSSVLEVPGVNELRFRISPKYVLDDHFWNNLAWRATLFQQCTALGQLLDVMDIVNKQPPFEGSRKRNLGNPANAGALQHIRDVVGATSITSQWLESKRAAAQAELQSALSAVQLLSSLSTKKEQSELSESVCESCRYRKSKVTALLGEVQASASKFEGTDLAPESGELYRELVDVNTSLHDVLTVYAGIGAGAASPDSTTFSPMMIGTGGSSVGGSEAKPNSADHGGKAYEEDTEFNAQLPWDDDDDEGH